jgi:hypothetical protein
MESGIRTEAALPTNHTFDSGDQGPTEDPKGKTVTYYAQSREFSKYRWKL